jgi:hypothetical protein
LNKDYLESILALLSASPFVHEPVVNVDDRDEVWFIRADVHFIDNSLLHFRELFVKQEKPFKKAYTYHYQREDETIVFRYDNAPHFPHLPTAPNHKHVGENDVVTANAPDLESVLKEIEALIKP